MIQAVAKIQNASLPIPIYKNNNIMKTSEFISLLEQNPNKALFFEYRPGAFVRPDYHITEIKNVSFDTVDCGGIQNKWEETHIQLWENEIPESQNKVDSTKALKIIKVVDKVRPTFQDTEVKFEYGNASFAASILPIHNVIVSDTNMIVKLVPDQTSCKAKGRATSPEEAAAACCGTPVKKSIALTELSTSQCSPGGGCC